MVIWGLSQFGPSDAMEAAEDRYAQLEDAAPEDLEAARMEASWLGHLGNWIEPVVRPLGYDGRMGISYTPNLMVPDLTAHNATAKGWRCS